MMVLGIDVSEFQENVDYKRAVQSGVEFALLRIGYSTSKDECFETHLTGFKRQGAQIGAYLYSYAKSALQAKSEANAAIQWLNGRKLDLPLYIDMEENNVAALGRDACNAIALSFVQTVIASGHKSGVYANSNWFNNYLTKSLIRNVGGSIWVADWGTEQPSDCDIWQFGGEYNALRSSFIPGIGICDQNYLISGNAGSANKTNNNTNTTVGGATVMIELPVLRYGAEGACVKTIQRILMALNYDLGSYGADGAWGDKTEVAVKAFQKARGLDVDGIVGANTWSALLK